MSIISEMGLFLAILVVISSVLRGFHLPITPPELFGDELDVGYQAYSLLLTGKDLYNTPLPTYLRSLSEPRAPLLIYATVPTIGIFGLTEWGVRAPEVVFGSIAPLLIFLLAYRTTKSKLISIFSSLALAIMPWHIMYSRAAFEVVLLLDLLLIGSLLYLKNKKYLAALFFALSLYTYSTALVFTPLIILGIFITTSSYKKLKSSIIPVLFLLVLSLPIFLKIITGDGSNRFNKISIFNDQNITEKVSQHRTNKNTLDRILYNRPVEYLKVFSNNYIQAFSPDFLIIRGDPTFRHSLQYIGQIYSLWLPLLLVGLYFLIRKKQVFWLVWLLAAPIPSALTSDGAFHATRLFLMIPPLGVAIGTGATVLFSLFKKIKYGLLLPIAYCLALLVQVFFVGHYYFTQYSKDSWKWWHVGYKSAMAELQKNQSKYSRIFINNTYEPSLIRFLFYTKYSPAKFHKEFVLDQPILEIVPGYDGFTLENKYFFGNFSSTTSTSGIQNYLLPGSLYLISQRDNVAGNWDWRTSPPGNVNVLSTSTDPNNNPILYLITKK